MSQLDRIELGIMNLVQAQKDRNHALVEENSALRELLRMVLRNGIIAPTKSALYDNIRAALDAAKKG